MTAHSYRDTIGRRGLQPFLWTQFLGAFNDNLFKIVVSMLAVHAATDASTGWASAPTAAVTASAIGQPRPRIRRRRRVTTRRGGAGGC